MAPVWGLLLLVVVVEDLRNGRQVVSSRNALCLGSILVLIYYSIRDRN